MLGSIYVTDVSQRTFDSYVEIIHETRVLVQWFIDCLSLTSSHLQVNISDHWIKVDCWLNLLKAWFVLLARIASYRELTMWVLKKKIWETIRIILFDFKSVQVYEAQFIHMNLLLDSRYTKELISHDANLLNFEDQFM